MLKIKPKKSNVRFSLNELLEIAENSIDRKFPINLKTHRSLYRIGYIFSKLSTDLRQTAIEKGICKIIAVKEQERKATIAKIKTYDWSK
tara:strand:- start:45 stop:311 length:267 start_codon:yes stop_codon:yes gene_type:complete